LPQEVPVLFVALTLHPESQAHKDDVGADGSEDAEEHYVGDILKELLSLHVKA